MLQDDGIKSALPVAAGEKAREYVKAATASNTRRGYQADLRRFLDWGGTLPAAPEMVADYLAAAGKTHKPATLARWKASLSKAHTSQGLADPCRTELVKMTLKGIRREHGSAQRQAAPLMAQEVTRLVAGMGQGARDCRDRALLLVGFAGALRRSELVALQISDLVFSEAGLAVRIRRSKTDPEGAGEVIGIPFARGAACPVQALQAWLECLGGRDPDSPVFRKIDRWNRIGSKALSGYAVALIIKTRCRAAGLDPTRYSGHSLRAGFCTSAALNGAPNWKIKKQSRHKSDTVLGRYIRDGRLFADNPVEGLL